MSELDDTTLRSLAWAGLHLVGRKIPFLNLVGSSRFEKF